MVWDFAFGKPCNHRVMEELVPVVVSPTQLKFNLTFEVDSRAPAFILTQNGVDITPAVVFTFNPANIKEVLVDGLTYNSAIYPPDDFTLEYIVLPDVCPKCFRRSY